MSNGLRSISIIIVASVLLLSCGRKGELEAPVGADWPDAVQEDPIWDDAELANPEQQ